MADVAEEAGSIYPFRAHGLSLVLVGVSVVHLLNVLCCVVLCLSSSCVLCTQCCQCLWIVPFL